MKYSNTDWKFFFWHSYGLLAVAMAAFSLLTIFSMCAGGQVRFAATNGDRVVIMDFLQFYAGAYLGGHLLGTQANIYDPAVQLAAVNAVIAPQKMATGFILQYPPYVFLMLAPLAAVSMLPAWMLSNAVGFVCLCATVWLVTQGMKPESRAFVLAAAAISAPGLNCVFEGQLLSPVLMLALLLIWSLLEDKKYFAAGVATAIGLLKIQYLPLLVVCGLLLGRWRYAGGLLAAFALLAMVSIMGYGIGSALAFPTALLQGESTAYAGASMMCNLRGLLSTATQFSSPEILSICSLATVAVLPFVYAVWSRLFDGGHHSENDRFRIAAAITTFLLPLVSLHTFQYDYLMVVPACVWIYRWLECPRLSRAARCLSIMVRTLILALPLLSLVYGGLASLFYVPISTIIVTLCLSILYLERQVEPTGSKVCSLVR